MQTQRDPQMSVAVPIFNEETVLPELYRRLVCVLADLPGGPHEIVFVDDGSSDGTPEILETLAEINPQVQVVSLSRNFGHQAALSAALDHVTGDVVVAMDGDLQDTPETIPQFLAEYARRRRGLCDSPGPQGTLAAALLLRQFLSHDHGAG